MLRLPAVLLALFSVAASAQTLRPDIKVGGYLEAFYQLNFNWPSNLITAYRAFDDRSNSFTNSNAALDVTSTLGPLSAHHAGLRLTYPITDRLNGILYVVNGWNDIVNRNPYPCFAGAADYAVTDALALHLLYFGGIEQPAGAPEGQPWRNLFDGTVSWSATSWLTLAAQADTGFENNRFGTSS